MIPKIKQRRFRAKDFKDSKKEKSNTAITILEETKLQYQIVINSAKNFG